MSSSEDLERRYAIAARAVQAGVAMELSDSERRGETNHACTPKQLRTGLNLDMVSHGALVRLLIAKGIFTEPEYFEELVKGVEQEQADYEARLSARYGGKTKIKLV